jgi:hypothetical protein
MSPSWPQACLEGQLELVPQSPVVCTSYNPGQLCGHRVMCTPHILHLSSEKGFIESSVSGGW